MKSRVNCGHSFSMQYISLVTFQAWIKSQPSRSGPGPSPELRREVQTPLLPGEEEYEVVLGDGSVVKASREENSDLYHCLPWSHGSLAFRFGLNLKIIPTKPYIHMKYIPVHGQKQYCDLIRKLSGADNKDEKVPDYLEATIYDKDNAVIMVGNLADVTTSEQKEKVNHVTRWYKPWFYKHVETFLGSGEGEEYIPLREYLLRHDKAIFWVLESMIPFGNHPLFLFLLGWMP